MPAQLTSEGDNLRSRLAQRLPSLASSLTLTLALPSCCQLRNDAGLLKLSDSAEHLAY